METLAAGGPKTIFGTQGTGDVYLLFLASPSLRIGTVGLL